LVHCEIFRQTDGRGEMTTDKQFPGAKAGITRGSRPVALFVDAPQRHCPRCL
jgi:hypothetical protein